MNSRDYKEGPHTPDKQECFRQVAQKIYSAIVAIYHNWKISFDRPAFYFDFNAGQGRSNNGSPGSPLIVAEIAKNLPYPVIAHLYEANPDSAQKLFANLSLSPHWTKNFIVHPENNMRVTDVLNDIGDRDGFNYYGLAYSDVSNGHLVDATNPLRLVAERQPRIDLLINYAAASWKRQIVLDHYKHASDILPTLGKGYWFIRKPIGKHQFTMILGSNYKLPFPKHPKENAQWPLLFSPEGKFWFEKINYTHDELDSLQQPPLF